MYVSTQLIQERLELNRQRKEAKAELWKSFLRNYTRVLDEEPQNFAAFCAKFRREWEAA